MKENKLLASVALFKELYDSNKDIYDVIGELLKAAIVFENKWAFNATEAKQMLESTFDFNIPEAVVKTTLKNRLKNRDNILIFSGGLFTLVSEEIKKSKPLSLELEATKKIQNEIIDVLISYISSKSNKIIDDHEKENIVNNFSSYLLDNSVSKKYSSDISAYIIQRKSEIGFTKSLNAVREGFVLYNGVRYTPDLSELGTWKHKLTIYLDTEYLFNAVGYSGDLHKQLFDDFYGLVREINQGKNKFIELKYFEECREEINGIFHVAERIIEGKVTLDPSRTVMQYILTGSKTKSDIISSKANLYSKLNSMRITMETRKDFYSEIKYNIEGESLISDLKEEAQENGWRINEDKLHAALKMFSKINILRQGVNSGAFEKIGHILVSGKSLTSHLAFNSLIKPVNEDIPFSTDLDFITNRFWFKMNKGLTNHNSLPRSLDVVAKAQVVLSSQIDSSISEKFDLLKSDLSIGKITKKDAEYLNNELRKNIIAPENLTQERLEETLSYLSHNSFEDHLREKSILEKKAKDGEVAIKKIEDMQESRNQLQLKRRILKAKTLVTFLAILIIFFTLSFYALFAYLIYPKRFKFRC